MLAVQAAAADEKAGTARLSLGEEMISVGDVGGEKKSGPLAVRRADKGAQVEVSSNCVELLDLPPEKQRLLHGGRVAEDHELLWDLGVRTDDEIALEFESPAMPPSLQVMRAPPTEKVKRSKSPKKKKK